MRAVALLLALVLAGCSGGGSTTTENDPFAAAIDDVEVQASATTGAIRGVVVDDAIRPLANVVVRLENANPAQTATTGASGAFGFSLLEPGTYLVSARLFGYTEARQTVEVKVGDANPPATKLQLSVIPGLRAYYDQYKWEGYMQCGTNNLIACAGPNAASQITCSATSGGQPPVPRTMPVCMGNLTNDEFTIWHSVSVNASLIQSEMVWDSTQALGDRLSLLLRKGSLEEFNSGFYNGSLNSSSGSSPLTAKATAKDMEDKDLGIHNGLVIAIFPGTSEMLQPVPFGAAASQTWTVYTHIFYGYVPPSDWTFVASNMVPNPA